MLMAAIMALFGYWGDGLLVFATLASFVVLAAGLYRLGRTTFTALVGVVADAKPPACPSCKSTGLTKLMSRVSALRSEDDLLDDLADVDRVGDLEDPKRLKKWVREMGKTMDEDMGDELEEMLEEEAAGGEGAADDAIY